MENDGPPVPVEGAHLLTSVFGRWPSFHDGEITALSFTVVARAITIEMTLEAPWFGREIRVRLRFDECAERPETEVIGFGSQNVLSEITWDRDGDRILAEFLPIASDWGVEGRIRCRRATVLEALVLDEPR